jgi:hypothetical protein
VAALSYTHLAYRRGTCVATHLRVHLHLRWPLSVELLKSSVDCCRVLFLKRMLAPKDVSPLLQQRCAIDLMLNGHYQEI